MNTFLKDCVDLISFKIDISSIDENNYISTENMLPIVVALIGRINYLIHLPLMDF